MELKNISGTVVFALESATTIAELVTAARSAHANLSYADLSFADLSYADLSYANLSSAKLSSAKLFYANLSSANLSYANLSYADLSSADLSFADLFSAKLSSANLFPANLSYANLSSAKLKGALIDGKPIINLRQISYSGYAYGVQAVLFEDGSRWVRMGCLWKSLAEWEEIGIRSSNPSEFPDDGSVASEERVAAFEFAKAAALRM